MRPRVQISFLSVFLTLLTAAFAAAIVVRVRAYSAADATAASPAVNGSSAPGTADGTTGSYAAPTETTDDTGTLVPAGTASSSSSGSQSAPASPAMTRAQRFRELLAQGLPAPAANGAPAGAAPATQVQPAPRAPAPAPKPQSPLGRLIQPIVNAFHPTPAPASVAARPASKPAEPQPPADPNSDTVPPQLLSVEFVPPQIQAGGDATLVVTARDDLSGIRGISGTLTSPSGKAVQGFAQQREGETMRYVSRIHMADQAEEGLWKISFLTMSDLATNTVTLSAAQGMLPPTAALKVVSSASDSAAPTLRNVWLDRPAMRAGEHNTLFVDATDEKSGVHLVAAVFLSPSKNARLGVGCRKGSGDAWECDVFPPECLDCGVWTLEQVQLQDNANNFATIRADNPAVQQVKINISGDSCDAQPPVLQGVSLPKQEFLMGRDEPVIEVIAQVSDDVCGVGGVSGQVIGPGGNSSGTFFSFTQRDSNTWVGTIRLHANSARGTWRIGSITVNDKGQNLRIYYSSDPLLSRAFFILK